MATSWTPIKAYIKALLGDDDPEVPRYSDAVLNQHMAMEAVIDGTLLGITANTIDKTYEEDITPLVMTQIMFQVAIRLILPQPDNFSYKNPVTSASRTDLKSSLLAYLREKLDAVQGNSFPVESQGEMEVVVKEALQYIADLNAGLNATVTEL